MMIDNKFIKLLTIEFNRTFNTKLEPQLLIVLVGLIIVILQFILFSLFSSQIVYCNLPNLRQSRLNCQQQQTIQGNEYENLPTIYVITPTYERYVQKAELVRLSHTLMLVPNLHWIIVEDSTQLTDLVSKFVYKLKNEFNFHAITQLHSKTPNEFKLKKGEGPSWKYPKGVWQRNKALEWLKSSIDDLDPEGVVYFADDDNTYDLELFQEMRYTRRVSVWPVGLAGGLLVEKPIITSEEKGVSKFNSMWESKRPFPIDMAAFAVSLRFLLAKGDSVKFSANLKVGYVESNFLQQLVDSWQDLEPKANKCTKVLVWHTKTQQPALHEERKLKEPSDSGLE